ncbi:MAG TPA: Gfo/Idh/MocA family oxidoreductase [Candidatus Angelobacter sp.]|jgi:predicted dehydrogenase|nr:Gfo/Idh/MocA family oxidoreductase [Candidatus Angelobacter sp.]
MDEQRANPVATATSNPKAISKIKDRRKAKIGVGVIGLGVAALSAHLPAIVDSDQFELVALCDRDPARLEYATRRWAVGRASIDPDDVLRAPGLDAVIVATPPDSHFPLALATIAKGKHLLVEKPLAPTLSESKTMVETAAKHGVHLLVGYEKRFHPTLRRVRSLLQDKTIGIPYYGGVHWASNAKMDPEHLVPEGYLSGYHWRWKNPSVGGGIIQDHLPHYVDLFRYWLDTTPVAIYAQTMNVARDLLGWKAKESVWEDLGLAVIRFSNGFLLQFETGTVGRSLSPLWAQGSGIGEWTEYGYIFGTEGQILFDLLPWDSSENGRIALWQLKSAVHNGVGWSYVEQNEPKRREGSPSGAAHEMFSGQLQEFARAITGEHSRCATGEDGLIGVAAVEAAYQSARTHREFALAHEELI